MHYGLEWEPSQYPVLLLPQPHLGRLKSDKEDVKLLITIGFFISSAADALLGMINVTPLLFILNIYYLSNRLPAL